MNDYQIVTDATVDLTSKFVAENDIAVIPMQVTLDDKDYKFIFEDGEITQESFFAKLRAGQWGKTSQINPEIYKEFFEKYLKDGKDIIYICLSSGLSGTIQAAMMCMEELRSKYPQRTLLCVDSLCASAGEGLLVYLASKRKREGMAIDGLYRWLEENKLHIAHWFTVENLNHLHRGGRISAATAIVGGALQIKPILNVDNTGHLENVDKARGRNHSLMTLFSKMKESYNPAMDGTVFICHGDCLAEAQELSDTIKKDFPQAEVHIFYMGPIIGAHTGAGVMALFFCADKR